MGNFFLKGYLINFFKTVVPDSKVIVDGNINQHIKRDAYDVISDFVKNSHHKK